jgi:WD40-like Beta Propeller Repeat
MLHPPRTTSTCAGGFGPGIPAEVDVHGTVSTEAIGFSLTTCQKPSARADAARDWLAFAPPHGAKLQRLGAALSPDRKRLAFVRGTPSERSALFVLDLGSRNVKRLTPWSGRRGVATYPHWALGGRRIVYAGCGPPRVVQPCALWSIRPDGSDPRSLTGSLETYPHFAVSPNGRWIAFTTALPGDYALGGRSRLRAERIDGSDRRSLANGFVSTPESWSVHGLIHFTRFPADQSPFGTEEAVTLSGHPHRVS